MNTNINPTAPPSILTHLGQPLSNFAAELADRYALSPSVPGLALLSVIGAAAGSSVRINTGLGADPISANIFAGFVSDCGPNLNRLLSHALRPLRQNKTPIHVIKPDLQFKSPAQPDNSGRQFPAKTEPSLEHPVLVVDSPSPGGLVTTIRRCDERGMLVAYDDFAALNLLEKMQKPPASLDLDVLARGWNADGNPETGMFIAGSKDALITAPNLSLMFRCSAATMAILMTDSNLHRAGVSPKILLVNATGVKTNPVPVLNWWQSEDRWESLVQSALIPRNRKTPLVIEPSSEARKVAIEYENRIQADLPGMAEEDRGLAVHWPEIVWKIMLILHLAGGNPTEAVTEATAKAAVAITEMLAAEQLAVFNAACQTDQQIDLETAATVMFIKIVRHAPIKRRELFRMYNEQSGEIHEPVVQFLLRQGRIVEDEDGFLSPAVVVETAPEPTVRLLTEAVVSTDALTNQPL